jgi:hypothetical protein
MGGEDMSYGSCLLVPVQGLPGLALRKGGTGEDNYRPKKGRGKGDRGIVTV